MPPDGDAGASDRRSPLTSLGSYLREVAEVVAIDAVDVELLKLLTTDGRMSQRRLAEEMGLSAPTVAERIARLSRKGVIRGYSVDIDWESLGYSTVVYVSVVISEGYDRGELMSRLSEARGVQEVTLVTGSSDLIVRVRVRDHGHLRDLLANEIWSVPGIQRTETSIGLGQMRGASPDARILQEIADDLARPTGDA